MKKFFTLIALALAAVSANAQTISISGKGIWTETDNVTVSPDGSAKQRTGTIVLSVANDVPLGGIQMDLVVPEGCELRNADKVYFMTNEDYVDRYGEDGYYLVDIEDEDGEVIGQAKTPWWVGFGAVGKQDGSLYLPIIPNVNVSKDHPEVMSYKLPAGDGAIGYLELRVPSTFTGDVLKFQNVAASIDEDGNTKTIDCPDFEVTIEAVPTEISTSIDRVDAQTLTGKEIYNLSGQRVSKPSQRGIYIVDGKKIMVK